MNAAMRSLALAIAAMTLLALPGSALARDRDRDALPDRWEKKHDLSTKRSSANADRDRDRVDNWNAWREGSAPRTRDSARDGRPDGREDRDRDGLDNAGEDATGNDPKDRDTDDDGVRDGKERAGAITLFEDGLLTIALAAGGSVTGFVSEATKVKCTSEAHAERRHLKAAARAASDNDQLEDEELSEADLGFDDDPLSDGEQLDHEGGKHGGGKGEGHGTRRCTVAALKPGTKVHKAKLEATEDGLVFSRVDLLR